MNRHFVAAAIALAAGSAFAGPYDQPYALVEAMDRSAVKEEMPAAITQIDGKSTRNTRRSDPIEPGKHTVTVRFSTGRVAQAPVYDAGAASARPAVFSEEAPDSEALVPRDVPGSVRDPPLPR